MNLRFLLLLFPALAFTQVDGVEFFEKKIRPVLATRCYACHASTMKSPMGALTLDTKAGLGKASGGKLISAIRYTDTRLQMPPNGKLPDAIVADFERWIAMGAPDPREDKQQVSGSKALDIETGRQWWAFQPVREIAAPEVKSASWPLRKIDSFVLSKLEAADVRPSPPADATTLIRRATLDLAGRQPTMSEIQMYSSIPYQRMIDNLLESPQYGERWGRYWLDVARYAEDNPTSEATNPPYLYAWRYRDWVIEAINTDVPYDRFVKLQLAADLMPGTPRDDLRALGFLGAAPTYHKDARLSKEVIETIYSDDWDERVDTVSRGLLGLTVACARCHDHKFDPILTRDYYSLAGIFASSAAVARPLVEVDPETEKRYLWIQQRLFHLAYLADLMKGEPGTKPEEAAEKEKRFRAEIATLRVEVEAMGERYPELRKSLERYWMRPQPRDPGQRRRFDGGSTEPFAQAVCDMGLWIDGADPDLTLLDYRPGTPRDLPVFVRGNVASPGEPAPRRFLTVLSKKGEDVFRQGSGRLELAERIFSEAAPLAARVMVNRVWAWHFGKPLANTTSDFGTQGEKPTHPELLDDLAARFIANGWSLKWLHREIMLSAAYRQSSKPRADGEQADPTNKLLWRMNPRRLDIEAYRDSILQAAGTLDYSMFGPSADLDTPVNTRRTLYGRVGRGRLNAVLSLYDFADASQHSPGRDLTITPLQQLFVMNSPFLQLQASVLAAAVAPEPDIAAKIRSLYRRVLAHDPSAKEIDLALTYLATGSLDQYAQALLASNELIFWP